MLPQIPSASAFVNLEQVRISIACVLLVCIFFASFQEQEIVNNAYVEAPSVQPRLSGASLMVARVMLRDGYEPRMGLGRNGDGMTSLVRFIENCARFG